MHCEWNKSFYMIRKNVNIETNIRKILFLFELCLGKNKFLNDKTLRTNKFVYMRNSIKAPFRIFA